jgi:fatty-acyl-CoA synthase
MGRGLNGGVAAENTWSSVQERRAALETRYPSWPMTTVDRHLARVADEFPDRPLVMTDNRLWTYQEVNDRAERLAAGLRACGVVPGDRVALVMANHPEFVPLVMAVWRLGAAAIPVNYLFKAQELAYVVGQSCCRVVVTMDAFRGLDYVASFDEFAPGWRDGTCTDFPDLARVVVMGSAPEGVLDLDALAAIGDAGAVGFSPATPTDAAVVMYTSGTTGLPKGVIQTHDGLLRTAYSTAHHRAFEDGRRILFALPLYHAFGLVEGFLASTFVGGAIIPQLAFDPGATLAGIERHRASDALMVPTMSVAILEHPTRHDFDLSSMRSVLAAAAPTPVWVWQQLRDLLNVDEVCTGYGMTETTASTTLTCPGDPLDVVNGTVGRPKIAGRAGLEQFGGAAVEYATVDPFTGSLLPPGEEGELVARGPTTTPGYFANVVETEKLLLPDGWVRSGDLGRIRADGYLELTGRSKELYKSGGELVAPTEVETVLVEHEAVAQAYVVGLPDDRWGEIGCAWLVLNPGAAEPSPADIVEWCRPRLAKFKLPRHVMFLAADALPTTPTGKVQKFRLVTMAQQRLSV